jgi:hypothetical protein
MTRGRLVEALDGILVLPPRVEPTEQRPNAHDALPLE